MKTVRTLTALWVVLAFAVLLTLKVRAPANKPRSAQQVPPPFTADKLIILARLRRKDFAGLDSEFEQYQRAFEKAPAAELNEKLAFDSFATDDSSVKDLIAEWIAERPNSFAAHMAMGCYFSWRGWHARGPAPASGTASERFEAMRNYFAEGADDTKIALKIKPNLSIAYAILIGEARGEGNWAVLRELQTDALRQIPASFVIREQVMESLYPRWGGSHELMVDLALRSQAFVKENPCMHWLLGFVDLDEGETLGIHGEYDRSIVALTTGIREGGDFSGFYFSRGIGYMYLKEYERALYDFNKADKLSPQDPELLIRRAAALAELDRPKAVRADLEFVAAFETPDDNWKDLYRWATAARRNGN